MADSFGLILQNIEVDLGANMVVAKVSWKEFRNLISNRNLNPNLNPKP